VASIHPYTLADGTKLFRVAYRKLDHTQGTERGFRTLRDAKEFISHITVTKASGTFIDKSDSKATVTALGATWLANKKPVVKASTFAPLEIAWRLHVSPVWGNRAIGSIRHSEIQSWVTKLSIDLGATSVIRAYGILSGILENAVKDRRLSSNPAKDIRLPRKVSKTRPYLTRQQVEALADAAVAKRGLVLFLAMTGLRWGEATGLRLKAVDPLKRQVSVEENAVLVGGHIVLGTPKNHERRTVPYPAFLDEEIAAACAGKTQGMLLFGDGIVHLRVPDARNSWWKTAVKTCQEKDATFPGHLTRHDLRHTTASLAVAANANVKVLQKMLGHKSAALTLDLYADLFESDLEDVAIALNTAWINRSVVKVLSYK
jgi:integrase